MKKGNVNIVRDHRENQKNKKISIRPNNWGVCFCADKHCAELPPDERERLTTGESSSYYVKFDRISAVVCPSAVGKLAHNKSIGHLDE